MELLDGNIRDETTLHNKVTAIKSLAKSYQKRLEGFRWDSSSSEWKPFGKALVGQDFITETTGIITSYCEYANLITTKDENKALFEYGDAFYRVNGMYLNYDDELCPAEHYRSVIKMFKDTLGNVIDIITGSGDKLKDIFKKFEEEKEQESY
jgi:hypothetical protein